MRRFGIQFVVLAVVLACLGALGSAPLVVADEATPAATEARCPSPLATPTASPAASSMATPSAEPVCVGVIVDDFVVRPQRTTFRVGETYIFAVGNEGAAVHEFVIEPAGAVDKPLEAEVNGQERESELEDLAPGATGELAWTFTESGRYQFSCHVPGHFEAGMIIAVAVVA